MTNSIRRGVTTSLLIHGEVRNSSGTLEQEVNGVESDARVHRVVGGGTLRSLRETSGETCRRGGGGRSQRPNSTDARSQGERRGQQNHAEGSGSGREKEERRIQVTRQREGTECQEWLGKFPMTGRSMLQNLGIDLKTKRRLAGGSGNGIGVANLCYLMFSHQLGSRVDIQPRWGNSRLESRVRENRTHGSEGGVGERSSLPLSAKPGLGPRCF